MKILSPVNEPVTFSTVVCRQAMQGDIEALIELDRVCFGRRAWPVRAWWEVITFPEWTTLVLTEHGQVIAASVLLPAAPVSWLASLAVRPGSRRRGLGRALLRKALLGARDASARWLSLEVDRVNRVAVDLYRKEGFGTIRRFREDGTSRLEMVHRVGHGRRFRTRPHELEPPALLL
jgi:ribosomal-protein-alanine N-acetyltransferase